VAQVRTTRYVCDNCNNDVAGKRDLRKFGVQVRIGNWKEETSDLCGDCEALFLTAASDFFPDNLNDLRREEK
jgi:hypothetical protein